MNITQIQVTYVDTDDRMVMRVSFGLEQSIVFTLTRRICRFILENIAELEYPMVQNATPERNVPLGEAVNQELPTNNFGDRPLLVENAECQRSRTDVHFIFFLRDVNQVSVNLSSVLAKGLEALLLPLVDQAGWFVPLASRVVRQPDQDSAEVVSTVLH